MRTFQDSQLLGSVFGEAVEDGWSVMFLRSYFFVVLYSIYFGHDFLFFF